MSKFQAKTSTYKGHKIIEIRDTENDKRVISFGFNKAKAISECFEAIQKFVEDNENKVTIDVDKLSDEQLSLLQTFIQR